MHHSIDRSCSRQCIITHFVSCCSSLVALRHQGLFSVVVVLLSAVVPDSKTSQLSNFSCTLTMVSFVRRTTTTTRYLVLTSQLQHGVTSTQGSWSADIIYPRVTLLRWRERLSFPRQGQNANTQTMGCKQSKAADAAVTSAPSDASTVTVSFNFCFV